MKSEIPKQFLPLAGKPVLLHTLEAFLSITEVEVILVLPQQQIAYWNEILSSGQHRFDGLTVAGGDTRFHSVKNGLRAIDQETALVAVHDGVRPLVSPDLIRRSYEEAERFGSAVTAVPLKDSLRKIDPEGQTTPADREAFRLVQTPQTFRIDWMRAAFDREYDPFFTDCASVLEHGGFPVHLIEGNYQNLKITTPEDLLVAEAFLKAPRGH